MNIHFQQHVEARVYNLFLQVPRARKETEEVKPIEKKKSACFTWGCEGETVPLYIFLNSLVYCQIGSQPQQLLGLQFCAGCCQKKCSQ